MWGYRITVNNPQEQIQLPQPRKKGDYSLEELLLARRSKRVYEGDALSLQALSQILWAAYGLTNERGLRTLPSAAALYPLEIYVIIGRAENLNPAIYHYLPLSHSLVKVREGDRGWFCLRLVF